MKIKQANIKDLDRVIELRMVNAQYHASLVSNAKLKETAESFFVKQTNEILRDTKTKVLIGVENEAIIAYAIGCIGQEHPIFELGQQALVDDVYVHAEFQRKGYGLLLIEELTEWFKENNCKSIDLNVYSVNSKGTAFWDKLGFETFFTRRTKEI